MGYLILNILSEIAHYKNQHQTSNTFLQIQLIVNAIQFLALLLPNDGWNIWKYNDDVALSYFQQIVNSLLILPISQDQQLIIQIITCTFFSLQTSMVVIIALLMLSSKYFPEDRSVSRMFNQMVSIVNCYFLNINQAISIPFEILYFNQFFCNKYRLSTSIDCTLQSMFYLGIIGIIFTVISQSIAIYLFRAYTFKPFSVLQGKYSINSYIIILLKPVVVLLYLLERSYFNTYIFFISFNCLLIALLVDSYYLNSYFPPYNEQHFRLIFSLFSISLLITLNVLSENKLITQNLLLVDIMLIGTASYHFSTVIWTRKLFHQPQSQLLQQCRTIDLVQRLSEFSLELQQSIRSKQFFFYYTLIINYNIVIQQSNIENFQQISLRKFIVKFLQNQLKFAKASGRIQLEQVELVYIDYLSKYCKQPLLSLVEFRKYDILNNQYTTFYFQLMKKLIKENIEKLIQKLQQSNRNQMFLREQEKQSLDIIHISKSIIFEELYIPNIIKLIDSKILFWGQLIKGYNTIYEFQNEAIFLSKKVQILQRQLLQNLSFDVENIDHVGTNCNVLELKIASIFYSSVMNDYYNSAQCEILIQEIFNIEHTLSSDIITNLTLIEDKVALLMVSLVKNLGQITNKDKRSLSQYFGYDEKEFQVIQFINQLMPNYLSIIHDDLLKQYLQKTSSKLFIQYNIVFSCDKQGYLIPQQLKIDNNFLVEDDYVIMGCLSQVRKGVDYLLFGEDGKIWGSTQNFFENYIAPQNEKISLQQFISSCYIQMLIPSLNKIIEQYKKKLRDFFNETYVIEETAQLIVSLNLADLMTLFQMSTVKESIRSEKYRGGRKNLNLLSEETESKKQKRVAFKISEKEKLANENLDLQEESNESSYQSKYQGVGLLNRQSEKDVQTIFASINDQQIEKYFIKFSLSFKSIGKNNYKRQYFILELHDIRKRDIIGQSISTNPHFNPIDSKQQSMQNNQDQTQEDKQSPSLSISGFTQTEDPYSEIVPVKKEIGCGIADGLKRMGHSKRHDQDHTGQYNLDSGRDSLSYGPLSQRANFINPNQQNENLVEKIDRDFNEMDVQFNSVSAVFQQQRQEQFEAGGDFEMEDSLNHKQQQQQQGKSSSNKEKQDENQILNVLQMNKLKGKNHEGEEVLKSKSSITSGTSGNSAIQLIKQFQSLTHLTSGLKVITFISLSIFLILIILITVNLVIIYINHIDTENNINNIYGPLILNRSYLEVVSFSWSIILDALSIVNFSEFMKMQQMKDLSSMSSTLNNNIYGLYLGFIQVEEKGLLSEQQYTFLNGNKESMYFPYFINMIELNLNKVTEITSVKNISDLLTQDYLNELFLLRFNLYQIQSMSSELIDSLNLIFLNQTYQKVTEMQTQVIIEIICIAIILVIELSFWRQIQNYCQQVMLLTGRLQESDANDLIARATLVKETLAAQSGKYSWKKQNYYSINYQNISQLNFDVLNTQSRILKDLFQKNHLESHTNNEATRNPVQTKTSKRNLNVVLSSRIADTSINFAPYVIMIGTVFLVLAFIFFGGFLLYSKQTDDLNPSQTVIANYLRFSSKMDTMIVSAMISKTQPLMYQQVIKLNIYDNATINSFSQTTDLIELLSELIEVYSENETDIYKDIISSAKIKQSDKQILYSLYQNDFCLVLKDEIPMCNIDILGYDKFAQQYGAPNMTVDDNREFISKGISGVESRLDILFEQMFYYEIDNLQFQPDLELSRKQIDHWQFRNAVFDHFLDTNDGTNKFFDLIFTSTIGILNQNLLYMNLYYGILGTALVVCYGIFYVTFIIHTNNKLIRIRLSLITLPISILTEQHTITMLKRLN